MKLCHEWKHNCWIVLLGTAVRALWQAGAPVHGKWLQHRNDTDTPAKQRSARWYAQLSEKHGGNRSNAWLEFGRLSARVPVRTMTEILRCSHSIQNATSNYKAWRQCSRHARFECRLVYRWTWGFCGSLSTSIRTNNFPMYNSSIMLLFHAMKSTYWQRR
jgi:hypothetical protein